jgi:hypothetical protein
MVVRLEMLDAKETSFKKTTGRKNFVRVEQKNSEGRENEAFKTKVVAWNQSSVNKEAYTSDLSTATFRCCSLFQLCINPGTDVFRLR